MPNSSTEYRGLGTSAMITALQRTRASGHIADSEYVCLLTLKALTTRCQSLAAEVAAPTAALREILDTSAPMLCDLSGVGTEVASQLLVTEGDNPGRADNEAQFAALVGVAPIPASCGHLWAAPSSSPGSYRFTGATLRTCRWSASTEADHRVSLRGPAFSVHRCAPVGQVRASWLSVPLGRRRPPGRSPLPGGSGPAHSRLRGC
ncbi:transposase [Arthrobacter sp. ISL-69]|uniref:transposase n=1 Tax=Arthrobacter sp. ISL-69 TaxID=2819113 RepID=UPI0037C19A31